MADPNEVRAQMILKDIYARHGINASMPFDDQIIAIENASAMKNQVPAGWSNPEEKAQARAAYAAKGKTPAEKQARWDKSQYLLDPESYEWQQGGGRDIDFLRAMDKARQVGSSKQSVADIAASGWTGGDLEAGGRFNAPDPNSIRDEALRWWDKSNFQPTYRDNVATANYQSEDGVLQGLLQGTTNAGNASGNYMTASETIPNRARMSGETETGQEAWEAAQATRLHNNRYGLNFKSPTLDLPSGSDWLAKADRIAQLKREIDAAAIPPTADRWKKWTKDNVGVEFAPPGFITDTLDFATSMLDPTVLIPLGGTAAGAGKVAAKSARLAGTGWGGPLLKNLTTNSVREFGKDAAIEQGFGHGVSAASGARTPQQWLLPDFTPSTNTPAKRSQAEAARSEIYERLKDDESVSRAEQQAYDSLGLRVRGVPYQQR